MIVSRIKDKKLLTLTNTKMKKYLLLFALFLNQVVIVGQTIQALQDKNGFQDLKIGGEIPNFSDFMVVDDCKDEMTRWFGLTYTLVYKGDKYKSIGDTKIKYVFLKIHQMGQDKFVIQEICIRCEYNPLLFATTESLFGKANGWTREDKNFEDGKSISGFMTWLSKDVRLVLGYKKYKDYANSLSSKIPDFITLTYSSLKIEKAKAESRKAYEKDQINKTKKDY
ncbi:hypothetical protein [Flavobacterium branchiophilum]|uniref:Uncharacterized protein n=1 Tax=Flavobacterium branchiophilum TaxID=55197 RepID=A0A2H3KAB4_9FLAO|nr:hypothetical protein [Flavobacterium branchiophilum]PDS23488.1 hypothetical protein B0A77_10715 [Flavobacterium branchiophilum]